LVVIVVVVPAVAVRNDAPAVAPVEKEPATPHVAAPYEARLGVGT
jgi:hypothetical protein